MKNLFLVAIQLIIYTSILAQDSTIVKTDISKLSEVRKFKNQLDLDVKSFFYTLSNATLIYKHKIETGKFVLVDEVRLLRAIATINTQISFTPDPARDPNSDKTATFHPSDDIAFTFGIGLEKQKRNKRFVHAYGIDLIGQYYKNDDYRYYGYAAGISFSAETERRIRIIRTGFNPFFGIKYYFSPRVSVGVETGIQIVYFNSKLEEYDKNSFEFKAPVISNGININFNNLRFLTVGYAF